MLLRTLLAISLVVTCCSITYGQGSGGGGAGASTLDPAVAAKFAEVDKKFKSVTGTLKNHGKVLGAIKQALTPPDPVPATSNDLIEALELHDRRKAIRAAFDAQERQQRRDEFFEDQTAYDEAQNYKRLLKEEARRERQQDVQAVVSNELEQYRVQGELRELADRRQQDKINSAVNSAIGGQFDALRGSVDQGFSSLGNTLRSSTESLGDTIRSQHSLTRSSMPKLPKINLDSYTSRYSSYSSPVRYSGSSCGSGGCYRSYSPLPTGTRSRVSITP